MHIEIKSAPRPAGKVTRSRRRTPGEKLIEALQALSNGKGSIAHHSERSWASVTFAGTRHRVEMLFEGEQSVEAGECFIAFLPEHEFTIPGQLVADAAVVEVSSTQCPPQMRVTCELLMLEES